MKKLILLLCIFYFSLFAQNEFLVNTYLDSVQRDPQIARASDGAFVIAWNSFGQQGSGNGGDIYFQRFNADLTKSGTETHVNDISDGNQEKPALAMNSSGTFVIAWASHSGFNSIYDVKVKLYKNNLPVSNEILVNTFTEGTQTNPDVAIDDAGNFVVVWDSWFQDGSDRGVYAQRFDADGNKVGTEFRVNVTTQFSQTRPAVRYLSNGNKVIIWESWRQDEATPSGYGVFARLYDANWSPIVASGDLQINSYVNDYQWYGDITPLENGFVVTWCSWRQDGSDGSIIYQRFDNFATRIGGEVLVNKTTNLYQWLPKVRNLGNGNLAFVWSSWRQDGDREGVYTIFFDQNNRNYTFETQVNQYSSSFQWEPDFIVTGQDEILVVWASWGQYNKDYEIIARKIKPEKSQGILNPSILNHNQGSTTSKFMVHSIDSTAMTGHTYEIKFDTTQSLDTVFANIRDINNSTLKINRFPLNKGVNNFYRTETFDGISVEFKPVFKLELDMTGSYMINNSGTNLIFNYVIPTVGTRLLAPIDIALVWGSTDTLANGQYSSPLDTALGVTGQRTVKVPFKAINLMSGNKLTLIVREQTSTKNDKWDPKEEIAFLTPPPFQQVPTNTHAQINSLLPTSPVILPAPGDTNFVLTKRPIKKDDVFTFVTNKAYIINSADDNYLPEEFSLHQNYPNPFNPSTTIGFNLPLQQKVTLKVFNILGELIATLIDDVLDQGYHRVLFDARSFASGIYFYTLESGSRVSARKMVLIK